MSGCLARFQRARLSDFGYKPRTTVDPKLRSTVVRKARRKEERLDNQLARNGRLMMSATSTTAGAATSAAVARAA